MSVYHFVGSYTEIGGGRIKLERFGQRVELPDDLADNIVKGGGAILPEAEFNQLGFTEQELSLYAYPGQWEGAPEAFTSKQKAAHVAFAAYKERVEAAQNGGAE
ncbi:MAG: hypothetical protein ACM3S5_05845 [Rhodospirillales bacterium]